MKLATSLDTAYCKSWELEFAGRTQDEDVSSPCEVTHRHEYRPRSFFPSCNFKVLNFKGKQYSLAGGRKRMIRVSWKLKF